MQESHKTDFNVVLSYIRQIETIEREEEAKEISMRVDTCGLLRDS